MTKNLQRSLAGKARWKKASKADLYFHVEKMNKARIKKMRDNKKLLEELLKNEKEV